MVKVVFPFIGIMIACFGVSCLFDKRFEDIIAPTLCAIVAVLQVFYILNILRIGYCFVSAVIFLGGLYALAWMIRKKTGQLVVRNILTSGLIIYCIIMFAVTMMASSGIIYVWDELHLWAAVPKALFFTEKLQLGQDALIYSKMQSYYPGLALLEYYFMKTSSTFDDRILYITYSAFAVSFVLPCVKSAPRSPHKLPSIIAIPIIIACVLFLPYAIFNRYTVLDNAYYRSLYIEPLLGSGLAYLVFLVYDDPFKSAFSRIRFSLALFMIIMLKDSGIIFALIALFASVRGLAKQGKLSWSLMIMPASSICFSAVAWKLRLIQYSVHNHLAIGHTSVHTDWQQVISAYIRALYAQPLWTKTFGGLTLSCSFLKCFLVMAAMLIMLYSVSDGTARSRIAHAVFMLSVASAAFLIGLLVLYVDNNWVELRSYARYISTIVLAGAWVVFMLFTEIYLQQRYRNKRIFLCLAAMCLAFSSLFLPYTKLVVTDYEHVVYSAGARIAQSISSQMKKDPDYIEGERKVVVYAQGIHNDILVTRYRVYYELLDENIYIPISAIQDRYIPFYTETSKEAQIAKLHDLLDSTGGDYLYIEDYDELFVSNFSELFPDGIAGDKLYKIIRRNGLVRFISIENSCLMSISEP